MFSSTSPSQIRSPQQQRKTEAVPEVKQEPKLSPKDRFTIDQALNERKKVKDAVDRLLNEASFTSKARIIPPPPQLSTGSLPVLLSPSSTIISDAVVSQLKILVASRQRTLRLIHNIESARIPSKLGIATTTNVAFGSTSFVRNWDLLQGITATPSTTLRQSRYVPSSITPSLRQVTNPTERKVYLRRRVIGTGLRPNPNEIIEFEQEVPETRSERWKRWAINGTSLAVRSTVSLGVSTVLKNYVPYIGPGLSIIAAPLITRGLLNLSSGIGEGILYQTGIRSKQSPPSAQHGQRKTITKRMTRAQWEAEKIQNQKEITEDADKSNVTKMADYLVSNAIPAVGSALANAAASAVAAAAVLGTISGTTVDEVSNLGFYLSASYVTGDYSYAFRGLSNLATGKMAQNAAIQYVASKIGWNTIGGFVGKKIHDILETNQRLGNTIFSDENRKTIAELIGREPDWLRTTYLDIISGLAKDSIDSATIVAARGLGQNAVDGLKAGYEAYQEDGPNAVVDLLNKSVAETYEETLINLQNLPKSASEWTVNTAKDVSETVSNAMSTGIKVGYDMFFGGLTTTTSGSSFEKVNIGGDEQKTIGGIRIPSSETEAQKRARERQQTLEETATKRETAIARRLAREAQQNVEIEAKRVEDMQRTNQILADPKLRRQFAMDYAKATGGPLAAAAILSQGGIKFNALGYQALSAITSRTGTQQGRQALYTGVGIAENEPLGQYVSGLINPSFEPTTEEELPMETTSTEQPPEGIITTSQAAEELTKEYYSGLAKSLVEQPIVLATGIKYDLARTSLIMGANAMELGGYATNNQEVQESAQIARAYLSELPTSADVKGYFYDSIGIEKDEVPEVDLNDVVTDAIFDKYLNPFEAKSNGEIAADVIGKVLLGSDLSDISEMRQSSTQALGSLLDIMDSSS